MIFAYTPTAELERLLRFHENDNGTMTTQEEWRRLDAIEQIDLELRRRREMEIPVFLGR